MRHALKCLFQPDYRQAYQAWEKEQQLWQALRNMPRFTPTTTTVLGCPLEVIDSASFLAMYREIYEEDMYRFKASSSTPYIIDCGANIGISVLYFKKQFPDAKIVAFEADPVVCGSLTRNLESFQVTNVEVINKAVWNADTTLQFAAYGADAGRVATSEETAAMQSVEAVRLRPYLQRPVDLLKMDIEGAETAVLEDCADLLGNVKNLFVEYHSFVNQEQTLDTLLRTLKQAGFRVYIRSVSDPSPTPFYERNAYMNMDSQLNIFAYRAAAHDEIPG